MSFENIVSNPDVLGGKPCIRGTRISIQLILEWLANGSSIDEIIKEFPQLNRLNIQEALLYASELAKNELVIDIATGK
jgi:uncharacterized protein (DUF433 family)